MADPIQRGGEWWTQREDGSWLRWDESSKSWQPSAGPPPPEDAGLPPVPPMPVGTGGYTMTPVGAAQTPIPNYLVWAILVTLFCFLPTGIVAIVFSSQVDSRLAAGDRAGALDSSNKARMWIIISVVAGLVLGFLFFGLFLSTANRFDVQINP